MQVLFLLEMVYVPMGMGEGWGARVGLAVIIVDGMAVWVPGWMVVAFVMAGAIGLSGSVVWFPDPVVDFTVCMVVVVVFMAVAVICVFGVVCFMVVFVAATVISALTHALSCLVEDTGCIVSFFTASVTVSIAWVVVWPAAVVLSADIVDTTMADFWLISSVVVATAWSVMWWPGAVVTWCSSVVCTVVLWLMDVVLREPVLLKWTVVPWWDEEWWQGCGWEAVVCGKDTVSGDSLTTKVTSAKQEENAAKNQISQ